MTVTSCWDCPFCTLNRDALLTVSIDKATIQYFCAYLLEEEVVNDISDINKILPNCPLKAGPITIKLELLFNLE